DGRINDGDAAEEARRLRRDGVRVDVHALGPSTGVDVAVSRVDAPRTARTGESVPVRATLYADAPTSVRLTLREDGELVNERAACSYASRGQTSRPAWKDYPATRPSCSLTSTRRRCRRTRLVRSVPRLATSVSAWWRWAAVSHSVWVATWEASSRSCCRSRVR